MSRVEIQWLSLVVSEFVVVFSKIVILMSLTKSWLGLVRKCLYIGRLIFILLAALGLLV